MSASMEEYAAMSGDTERPKDDKGRVIVQALTDREVAEETLYTLRALADVLEAVGQNPMARAMMPGLGNLGGK